MTSTTTTAADEINCNDSNNNNNEIANFVPKKIAHAVPLKLQEGDRINAFAAYGGDSNNADDYIIMATITMIMLGTMTTMRIMQ